MGAARFLHSFDLFNCVPSLRSRGQADVSSICGGVTSLLIMMGFIYVFIADLINMVNYGQISAVQSTQILRNSNHQVDDLVFAIGIDGMDLGESLVMLDIYAEYQVKVDGEDMVWQEIQLVPCVKEIWSALGDTLDEEYSDHGIKNMLCTRTEDTHILSGLKRMDIYTSLRFTIQPCNANFSNFCAPYDVIQKYINDQVLDDRYFVARFVYLNTGFNTQDEKAIVKYVDDKVWLTFTDKYGTEAFIDIGTFQISTDTSFFPWSTKVEESGNYLAAFNTAQFSRTSADDFFIDLQITKSAEHKTITRDYGKIDDRLSYIGGLFEIVIIFLSFFLMSYNQYRYELMVGETAYSDPSERKAKEDGFHFLKYMKYVIYDWISLLCCCKPSWEDCQKIDQSREEVNQQMDVQMLLRRISFLEDAIQLIITEKQEKSLYLKNPHTLEYHRKKRDRMRYYDKMLGNKPPITIQHIRNSSRYEKTQIIDLNSEESLEDPRPSSGFDDSLIILNKFMKNQNAQQHFEEKKQLNKEEEELEQEMAHAFFDLKQETRNSLQKQIPVEILKRLSAHRNSEQASLRPENILVSHTKRIKVSNEKKK